MANKTTSAHKYLLLKLLETSKIKIQIETLSHC